MRRKAKLSGCTTQAAAERVSRWKSKFLFWDLCQITHTAIPIKEENCTLSTRKAKLTFVINSGQRDYIVEQLFRKY